jgi:hypothetical protein
MSENNKFIPPTNQELCKDPTFQDFCGCIYPTYTEERPASAPDENAVVWKFTEEHVAQALSIPLEWLGLSDEIIESCHKHEKYTLLSLFRMSTLYMLEIFNNDCKTLCWVCTLLHHLTGYLPVTQGVLDRVDHYNKLCKDNLDRIKSHMNVSLY